MVKAKDYEVFIKVCKKCGKRIISLSEDQADYNLRAHEITCKGAKK